MVLLCSLALMLQSVFAFPSSCSLSMPLKEATFATAERHCQCDPNGPERACCKTGSVHGTAIHVAGKQSVTCKCTIQTHAANSPSVILGTPPTNQMPALLADPVIALLELSNYSAPGIFGVDSGPPLPIERAPDLGRAPPVA